MRPIVLSVRTIVIICVLATASFRGNSQSITSGNGKLELGLGVGPLFFLGDLGGNYGTGTQFVKDVNWGTINVGYGLFFNYYPTEWLGFRLAFNKGKVEGYDSLAKPSGGAEEFRWLRNLQFQSNIMEAYAAVEIYPTVFFEKYDGLQGKIRPYIVAGVGAFKFKPQGRYYHPNGTSEWVDLQPLRLEGQGMAEYPDRKPYSLISLEIPVGLGFKYYVRENFYVGFEVMHRKSFTDYVDDVSTNYIDADLFAQYLTPQQATMANQLHFRENFGRQNFQPQGVDEQRGNPKNNDSFFSSILRVGWRLNEISPGMRAMRCPNYY